MLNQAQIIGRLGKDPETRRTPQGIAITNFNIATSEKWKDKASGQMKEATEWHRITTFDKLAEICEQYLKAGSLVFIQGKLTTQKYKDKDGIERYQTSIKADNMKMLGDKGEKQEAKPAKASNNGSGFDDLDNDVPF